MRTLEMRGVFIVVQEVVAELLDRNEPTSWVRFLLKPVRCPSEVVGLAAFGALPLSWIRPDCARLLCLAVSRTRPAPVVHVNAVAVIPKYASALPTHVRSRQAKFIGA